MQSTNIGTLRLDEAADGLQWTDSRGKPVSKVSKVRTYTCTYVCTYLVKECL